MGQFGNFGFPRMFSSHSPASPGQATLVDQIFRLCMFLVVFFMVFSLSLILCIVHLDKCSMTVDHYLPNKKRSAKRDRQISVDKGSISILPSC